MEFLLTPHTKNIIIGRGLGYDDIIICASNHCIQRENEIGKISGDTNIDPNWGKEIEVKGFIICGRCGYRVIYPEHLGEFDEDNQEIATHLVCPVCSSKIPIKNDKGKYLIIWTQVVVSKHRRQRHCYYHKECWDALFNECKEKNV